MLKNAHGADDGDIYNDNLDLDHPGVCSLSDLSPYHQDGKIPLDRFAAILEVIRCVVESLTALLLSSS